MSAVQKNKVLETPDLDTESGAENTAQISVRVSTQVKRAFHTTCINKNTTMNAVLAEFIQNYIGTTKKTVRAVLLPIVTLSMLWGSTAHAQLDDLLDIDAVAPPPVSTPAMPNVQHAPSTPTALEDLDGSIPSPASRRALRRKPNNSAVAIPGKPLAPASNPIVSEVPEAQIAPIEPPVSIPQASPDATPQVSPVPSPSPARRHFGRNNRQNTPVKVSLPVKVSRTISDAELKNAKEVVATKETKVIKINFGNEVKEIEVPVFAYIVEKEPALPTKTQAAGGGVYNFTDADMLTLKRTFNDIFEKAEANPTTKQRFQSSLGKLYNFIRQVDNRKSDK